TSESSEPHSAALLMWRDASLNGSSVLSTARAVLIAIKSSTSLRASARSLRQPARNTSSGLGGSGLGGSGFGGSGLGCGALCPTAPSFAKLEPWPGCGQPEATTTARTRSLRITTPYRSWPGARLLRSGSLACGRGQRVGWIWIVQHREEP